MAEDRQASAKEVFLPALREDGSIHLDLFEADIEERGQFNGYGGFVEDEVKWIARACRDAVDPALRTVRDSDLDELVGALEEAGVANNAGVAAVLHRMGKGRA